MGGKVDAKAGIECLKDQDGAGEGRIWAQFHDIPVVLNDWPVEHVELPEAFGDTLKEASRSTRIEHVQKNLIAVVNNVNYDFERKKAFQSGNGVAECKRSLSSERSQSSSAIGRPVAAGSRASGSLHSPMGLLIHLLQRQADALLDIVRSSAQTANNVGEVLLAGTLPTRSP
jgi:zinc transporter